MLVTIFQITKLDDLAWILKRANSYFSLNYCIQASWRRWPIFILWLVYATNNAFQFLEFTSIMEPMLQFYNVTEDQVLWMSGRLKWSFNLTRSIFKWLKKSSKENCSREAIYIRFCRSCSKSWSHDSFRRWLTFTATKFPVGSFRSTSISLIQFV